MIHKMVLVLQETFLNDHLVKKDDPPKSSTTQRMELRLDTTALSVVCLVEHALVYKM